MSYLGTFKKRIYYKSPITSNVYLKNYLYKTRDTLKILVCDLPIKRPDPYESFNLKKNGEGRGYVLTP